MAFVPHLALMAVIGFPVSSGSSFGAISNKWQLVIGPNIRFFESLGSTPAVGPGGTIFVSGTTNFMAIRPSGEVLWRKRLGNSIRITSPAVSQRGVIYTNFDTNLYAIAAQDGTVLWTVPIGNGVNSSVAIRPDGAIIVNARQKVLATDATGKTIWTFETNESNPYSSPTVSFDGVSYVGTMAGQLHAIGLAGEELWNATLEGSCHSSPSLDLSGNIYVGTSMISPSTEGGRIYCINRLGTVQWAFKTPDYVVASPVIRDDGTIIAGCKDGNVYALSPAGQEKWRYALGGFIFSSCAVTRSGRTIVVGRLGKVRVLSADGEKEDEYDFTSGFVDASSVLTDDGTMYISTWGGKLLAFDIGEGPSGASFAMFRANPRNTSVCLPVLRIYPQAQSSLSVYAEVGSSVTIEASTTLKDWIPISTNKIQEHTNISVSFENSRSFYRAFVP